MAEFIDAQLFLLSVINYTFLKSIIKGKLQGTVGYFCSLIEVNKANYASKQ